MAFFLISKNSLYNLVSQQQKINPELENRQHAHAAELDELVVDTWKIAVGGTNFT